MEDIKCRAHEGHVSNLCESVRHQLNMYALAAVVAVVSVLALTQPSAAKIVYRPANVVIADSTYNLDLNNDGIADFSIPEINSDNGGCVPRKGIFVWLNATPMQGSGIVGSAGLHPPWRDRAHPAVRISRRLPAAGFESLGRWF
jgi:hypothetical protein